MDYYQLFVFSLYCFGSVHGQFPSLLNSQQGAQNAAHNLLQQTLRNQASMLSNMGTNPALDMLMSNLNAQQQPGGSSPRTSVWNNMFPADQLLQQQRGVHSSLLQSILNNGIRSQSPTQSSLATPTQGTSGPQGPFDSVRVVVYDNRPHHAGSAPQSGPIPTVESGFSSTFTSGPTSSHFFENLVSGGFSTDTNSGINTSGSGGRPLPVVETVRRSDPVNTPGSSGRRLPVVETVRRSNPVNVAPVTPSPSVSQQSLPTSTRQQTQPALTCTGEYRQLQGHTLCMEDNQGVTYSGVSIDDKLLITQFHNELRAGVQPPAADLLKLHWDDRLAAVAEKWAKQCTLAHDKERSIPELGLSVGQNVAVGYDGWQIAIQQWYDEIRKYKYGLDPDSYLGPEGWREIAHFTQMVQNGTYLIGCGYAECPYTEYIRFYVCNYASGQSDLAYPYTAGAQCGRCPNNCVNGLCDCGNLVCRNKGTLDPATCTCDCPKPYKGQSCEIVDCPAKDKWICGRDWPPSYCGRFYNVPEECPHMCGLCAGGGGGTSGVTSVVNPVPVKPAVVNETFTSAFGCKYTGKRDNKQACTQYGDRGSDMKMCASHGGTVGCSECDRFFNIKKDYCPVMCGLCDPPCNGKKCLNGGTLDTASCSCQCRPPFTGDMCQLAQCPVDGDPRFCRYWPERYCDLYHNVPEECPYKCGICTDRTDPAASNSTA